MNEALSYDVMGNITSMSRSDGTAAKTGTYNYTGNRLNNISGGLLATGNYAYDANGNAVTDGRNGISLTYNVLNLPETAVRTSGTPVNIAYAYSAGGEKLKKTSGTTVTDYVGGIQYENGSIDFIQTEEGMAKRIGTDYVYQYNLTDHLGNVRVTFNRNPSTGLVQKLQEDNYYAFGLRRVASAGTNKYLYNGKELQEELEQYDYGARFYDPVIGRWNSVDPHTERYESITPYSYAFNNPARFIDVKGKDPGDVVVVFGGADLFSKKDKGGAPLIVQQLQDKYFKQKGGIAESYSSDFWGNGALAKDHLDEATQSAYDLILANHNKDGGKEVKDGQVIIEGYSYGGVLANHLAKRLKEADVKVNLLVTVDAAAGPGSPFVDREISSNVEKNVNYYQTKPSSIRSRGDKNRREKDNTTTEIINLDVTKFVDGHGNIDDKLLMNVVNRILNQLK